MRILTLPILLAGLAVNGCGEFTREDLIQTPQAAIALPEWCSAPTFGPGFTGGTSTRCSTETAVPGTIISLIFDEFDRPASLLPEPEATAIRSNPRAYLRDLHHKAADLEAQNDNDWAEYELLSNRITVMPRPLAGFDSCTRYSKARHVTEEGAVQRVDEEFLKCAVYRPDTDLIYSVWLSYSESRPGKDGPGPGFKGRANAVLGSLRAPG